MTNNWTLLISLYYLTLSYFNVYFFIYPRFTFLIDKEYFEESGFGESTDFLVLALLVDLGLIEKDGTPTKLLIKFRNRETSKEALAYGVVQAYEDLFEDNPTIYNSSNEEIIELIQKNLDSNKSDIILNYMAKTIKTLVGFVGPQAINSVWEQRQREREDSSVETVIKKAAHNYGNGNGQSTIRQNHADTSVAEMVDHSESEKPDFEEEEYADTETLETDHENQDNDADMDQNEQNIRDTINFIGKQQHTDTDVSEEEFEQSADDPFGVETEESSPSAEAKLNQQISDVDKAIIKKRFC